jgi:hypothetical protein
MIAEFTTAVRARIGAGAMILMLILLAVAPEAASAAAAEEGGDTLTWSVAPADATGSDGRRWAEHTLNPGESVTDRLALRNLSDVEVTFTLAAADGYFTSTGRFNMLDSGAPSAGAGTWISIPQDLTVAAGETIIVPYTITAPQNATPGDHAAGIAASVVSRGSIADGAQVGVESRVGFRVLTRITGELDPSLTLADIEARYEPNWNPFQPGRVVLDYGAQNTGNVQLSFSDSLDGSASADRGDLLPGESRHVSVVRSQVWPLGLLTLELMVSPIQPDGVGADAVRETVTVWAPPLPQLAVLVGLLLILVGVRWGNGQRRRRLDNLIEAARDEGRRESGASGTVPS